MDYDALLSQRRNVLLGPQQPTTREAIRAGIQSTTGTPYAENRSNIMAEKYNRALSGYQVLSNERDFQTRKEQQLWQRGQSEREFQARKDQQVWQRAQAEAARGDKNFAQLLELSSAYGANEADSQRLASWVIQQAEERNMEDPEQVPGLVAEGAEALGLPARPELTLMNTAGGGVTGIDPMGETRTIVEGETAAAKPYTDIGKLNSDLNAGLITPAQALQEMQRLNTDDTETWRPMTPEERTQYGVPEGRAAQISTTGKASVIGSSGGVTLYDGQTGNIIAQVGGAPLTDTQVGKQGIEIAEEIRTTGERLSELSSAMRSLEQTPEATGISGALIENVGGVVEQIANLAGMDGDWLKTAEVQTVRTQLATLLGQYLPRITGDDGSRYSDQDMRRARAAMPGDRPTASYNQVRASLLTLGDIERRARARALMRLDGYGPAVDITYPDARESYAVTLFREGKSPEEAAQIIQELMDKYEISLSLEGVQ